MDTTINLSARAGDIPTVIEVTTSYGLDIVHIGLTDKYNSPRLIAQDPAYLRALARVCEDAATQLADAIAARAADQQIRDDAETVAPA